MGLRLWCPLFQVTNMRWSLLFKKSCFFSPCFVSMRTNSRWFLLRVNTFCAPQSLALKSDGCVFLFLFMASLCAVIHLCIYATYSCGSQRRSSSSKKIVERLCWPGCTGNLLFLSVLNHLMNMWMTEWHFCTSASCCMPMKWLKTPIKFDLKAT